MTEVEIRKAQTGDQLAIEELHRRARFKMPWLWWWEKHLADDLFIVIERDGVMAGAFFAWPDESPVAWARLAALDNTLEMDEWLDLALPPVFDGLRRRRAQKLAWMDYDGWAGPRLEAHGFRRLTEVITLAKLDRTLPEAGAIDASLRPASDTDVPATVTIDRAAFTPHWWHSESTLRRRVATSSLFTVAETAGAVVGYVEGERHLPTGHLNRLAVHPAYQGHGIGAWLLNDALRAFWQRGANWVTLNTQGDNDHSRRLYQRFGFEPTGDVVLVWEAQL